MVGLLPILSLVIIAAVSLLIVRVGAMALRMTGMSEQAASFQALSGFFGVGFTTHEAEMIVSHPVRRRIMAHLIIMGNIGVTGALAALVVTFVNTTRDGGKDAEISSVVAAAVIIASLLVVWLIFGLGLVKGGLDRVIRYTLEKSGAVHAMDYDLVLRASSGYAIVEYEVDPGHPLVGKTLEGASLGRRGVLVIGIQRDQRAGGVYVGAPDHATTILAGDVLTLYGLETSIRREMGVKAEPAQHPPA
ncbi:MAG: TrkA C-terminal domain-containing protein [Phycisphaerales bacterium]